MYVVPHEVTFKVKLAVLQTRIFSHYKETHMHVILYNKSYQNLFEGISFVFVIFHTHMECICRWKFIKNKKTGKMKHSYNKDKTHYTILKR